MTEPKFSIGQHVAVCGKTLLIVLPSTIIEAVRWAKHMEAVRSFVGPHYTQVSSGDGYYYWVAGTDRWIRERSIRPINPDTEYQDTEQEKEKEV